LKMTCGGWTKATVLCNRCVSVRTCILDRPVMHTNRLKEHISFLWFAS
jgi:hypothetical protein